MKKLVSLILCMIFMLSTPAIIFAANEPVTMTSDSEPASKLLEGRTAVRVPNISSMCHGEFKAKKSGVYKISMYNVRGAKKADYITLLNYYYKNKEAWLIEKILLPDGETVTSPPWRVWNKQNKEMDAMSYLRIDYKIYLKKGQILGFSATNDSNRNQTFTVSIKKVNDKTCRNKIPPEVIW